MEFEFGSPRLDSAVAASKFNETDGFAEKRAGHIVLQDHSDDAWFRNLRIRRLSPASR